MGKVSSAVGSVSRPGKRWSASRRLKVGNSKAIATHNWHVGEVLYAFNAAHASLYAIFTSLAAGSDWNMASDLWHAQKSDFAQRQMLSIYVKHCQKTKSIRRSILWCIAALDELSLKRNDFVHADFIWYYDQLVPGLATERKRRKRLESVPFERHWLHLRGDLSAVANYAYGLYHSLHQPRPLTKKPRLKLADTMSQKQQSRRSQAKKKVQELQRQSSVV